MARPDRLTRDELVRRLYRAGFVAAEDEADDLIGVAQSPEHLHEMVERRLSGEPLAWITGEVRFCGVRVVVHPGVYVPRWQSEQLVRTAASHLRAGEIAIDLCTGSGALAVALNALVPGAEVIGTEIDDRAAACARENGIKVHVGDLDAAIPNRYFGEATLVIGVVPYVPTAELKFLPRDVLNFEPRLALDGGPSGTRILSRAVQAGSRLLRSGGLLLLELGGDEDVAVLEELAHLAFRDAEVVHDQDGDVRGVAAFRR